MGDIHRFTLRLTPSRQLPPPGPAEVIIFPGVRFEHYDAAGEQDAIKGKAGVQRHAQVAVWTDD